jgi:hypothetical protein
MEHYLRQAGWRQGEICAQNWVDVPGFGTQTMRCHRLQKAVEIQVRRDKRAVAELRERLAIVGEG